jgi:catechol 2,3-dioxygenase-like lactoylglutathione lyase family enzyme
MAEIAARLDHAGLAVAGLEAAAAWYCDVFGLVPELSLKVDAIDLSIEMLIHPSFGYRIELLHRPGTGTTVGAHPGGKPASPAVFSLAGAGHRACARRRVAAGLAAPSAAPYGLDAGRVFLWGDSAGDVDAIVQRSAGFLRALV